MINGRSSGSIGGGDVWMCGSDDSSGVSVCDVEGTGGGSLLKLWERRVLLDGATTSFFRVVACRRMMLSELSEGGTFCPRLM